MANNVKNGDLDKLTKNECWSGKKTASQVKIDCEATEVLLTLLENNWESLNDSITSRKHIWNKIADGLEEVFIVRGEDKGRTCQTKWENMRKEYRSYLSKFKTGSAASDTKKPKFFDSIEKIIGSSNHSYKPPYVSDSLKKTQNPKKFQEIGKNEKTADEIDGVEKSNKGHNSKEEKLSKEKVEEKDGESTFHITDNEIYMDSLEEKSSDDEKTKKKKKKPSKSSKSEKVLQVFQEIRHESNKRHLDEKNERQKRHEERMEKSQQMIDVLKTLISSSSKKKSKTKSSSKRKSSPSMGKKPFSSRENIKKKSVSFFF